MTRQVREQVNRAAVVSREELGEAKSEILAELRNLRAVLGEGGKDG